MRRWRASATCSGVALVLTAATALAQSPLDHADPGSEAMTVPEMTRQDVAATNGAGPADVSRKRLATLDLSGLTRSGARMRGAVPNRADLSGTVLQAADLNQAWAPEADLSGADQRGASLFSTQMQRADLAGARLSGARIRADLSGAILSGADLTGARFAADMTNQSMGQVRAVLRSAKLDGATLAGADLRRVDFSFASMQGVAHAGQGVAQAGDGVAHAGQGVAQAGGGVAPLAVREVADGVFVHAAPVALADPRNRGDIANLGFIVGDDGVAVVDTGGSVETGERLRAAIAERTALPVLYVINTHMHPDHTFGNAAFRGSGPGGADPAVVGHAALAPALAARAGHYLAISRDAIGADLTGPDDIVLADTMVDATLELDLGDRPLELQAWPTAHTNNDLTVFDVRSRTLFAGDLLFMQHLPVVDGSIKGWLGLEGPLAAIPAERVVPGHGPAVAPWPEALAAQQAYLARVAEAMRGAIKDGVPLAEAVGRAAPPGEAWALTDTFHGRNLTAAYAELEWE